MGKATAFGGQNSTAYGRIAKTRLRDVAVKLRLNGEQIPLTIIRE